MCRKIKSLLENRSLGEKFDAQFQWRLERKEEKKQKTKNVQIINSVPTFLNPKYGYHSACYKNFIAICKPKSKSKTTTRSSKISTGAENISVSFPRVLPPIYKFLRNEGKKLKVQRKNLEKMKYVKLK